MKKSISVLLVVVMVLALSATAFAAGEGPSYGKLPEPPLLENKEISGTGKTANGEALTIAAWNADDVPALADFNDEKSAVESALKSDAFDAIKEKLGIDPETFSGSSLISIKFEDGSNEKDPVTVVLFYDGDGNPITGLYFFDGGWHGLEVKVPDNGADGEYTLVLGGDGDENGLDAEIPVTITEKPEA